jgi:hypothetical protein
MKKILIIETEYEGHYLTGYIKYILRSFKNQKVKITLLTSADAKIKAKGALKILKKEKVKFNIKTIRNLKIDNYSSLQLIINQIRLYFVIKKKFREMNSLVKFDHVLLTSIQKFDKALVFFGSPFQDVGFSGIYLGVKFHLYKYAILYQSRFNYLEKQFFKRLLYIPTLQNIITNDHLLKNYLQSEKWNNCDKLHFLHDPKEFNFNFDKFYSRKRLHIPKKSIVILVYGALIESKGILELLSIFNNKKLNTNIRIISAGKQLLNKESFLLNNNFVNKLKLQKKIFIFNSWITEKKEALLFSATDIVWLGYKNYSSPSGVFYQAIQRSLPSLISNDGLINNLNKIVKVGYSINIYNPLNIIEGINYLLNKKNRSKLKKNILKFSRISESRKWVSNFKKIHSKIFY